MNMFNKLVNCIYNGLRLIVKRLTKLICFITLLASCFFVNVYAFDEGWLSPNRSAPDQMIKLAHAWPASNNFSNGRFSLVYERCIDIVSNFVEFSPTVSANSKFITEEKTDKERKQTKDMGIIIYELFKHHGFTWEICFLFGLISGGAFGWPPFTFK